MTEERISDAFRIREHQGAHRTITTSRLRSEGRKTFFFECRSEGEIFVGEASPLPGYGSDDPARARRELEELAPAQWARLRGELESPRLTIEELEELSKPLTSPAARFALETAWLEARAARTGRGLFWLLRGALGKEAKEPPQVPTSAVLDAAEEEPMARAGALFRAGIRTFKVKCGLDIEREKALLTALSELGQVHLRVDPNLAWSREELEKHSRALTHLPIEYIEDPSLELSAWKESALPVAIDEPLTSLEPKSAALGASVQFLILKPMALGGFSRALRWAQVAEQIGASPIVSHLFDGPVALDAAAALAFAVQDPERAAGLGDHAGLFAFSERPRSGLGAFLTPPGVRAGSARASGPA